MVPAPARQVWLTFDDGPHNLNTSRVLDALQEHDAIATFFVIGENVRSSGCGMLERAVSQGHGVGNHTYSHPDLRELSAAEIVAELQTAEALIGEYLGKERLFRPPFGRHNELVKQVAEDMGYQMLLWDVDTRDWDADFRPDKWRQHALDQIRLRDDSVVLCHDPHDSTADGINVLLASIEQLGDVSFRPYSAPCLARIRP